MAYHNKIYLILAALMQGNLFLFNWFNVSLLDYSNLLKARHGELIQHQDLNYGPLELTNILLCA